MDQPSSSKANKKHYKDEDKANGQSGQEATNVKLAVDFREEFSTDTMFKTREDFKKWICGKAEKLGFSSVIAKSDNGGKNRRPYVLMGCQRGGSHRTYVNKRWELTTSLKCDCPFRIKSYYLSCGKWSVSVLEGRHNHIMARRLEGHKIAERLKEDEAILVREMTKNNALPRDILSTIRRKNSKSSTTIKHIYNVRQRMTKEERGDRSEMQQLLKSLSDGNYTYSTRVFSDNETISDLFFTHPDSIKLVNLFPIVVVMDSTYKTNKYGLPLLEFVGNTCTELTFSIGFAFMTAEKEDNFVWTLERFRDLVKYPEYPTVIVTDRDATLMNVVDRLFPKATALFCRHHITVNVRTNMKLKCNFTAEDDKENENDKEKQKQLYDDIMAAWETILNSETEEDYVVAVILFRELCAAFPIFVDYVESTILGPVKEKVVCAWTNRVMHMGNTTTNRVKSTHARLKLYIQNCMGGICKNWDKINQMLTNQIIQIHRLFEKTKIETIKQLKGNMLFSHLHRNISRKALERILVEVRRVGQVGSDKSKCGCISRTTFELPYACELDNIVKDRKPICLDIINCHWKRLSMEDADLIQESRHSLSLLPEWEAIRARFNNADYSMQVEMKEKFRQFAYPETTSMQQPTKKVVTKGAPKKTRNSQPDRSTKRDLSFYEHVNSLYPDTPQSQTSMKSAKKKNQSSRPSLAPSPAPPIHKWPDEVRQLPPFIHQYYADVINVLGDGHCGFRAVSVLLGKS